MVQGGVVAVYTKNNLLVDYIEKNSNTLVIKGINTLKTNQKPVL